MRRAALLGTIAMLLVACSSADKPRAGVGPPGPMPTAGETTTGAPTTTIAPYPTYRVATAEVPRVAVYDEMNGEVPRRTFANPNPTYNTPRTFLVNEEQGDWLNVYLPARPNGSTGWIKKSDVSLTEHNFRILVELGAHQLTVYERNDVVLQEPVGVGRSASPSTTGLFYTTELIAVYADEQAAYGPFAYGLSAYSEVFYSFGSGDGQMGIHGTGDPSSVGKDVSNGCIRMTNDAITRLRNLLPIGVPVEIRP